MASLVEHEHEETNEQRLLKTVAYMTVLDDYCKQIIRESDTMRTLNYDINVHTDDQLTHIIMDNFYSIYQPKDNNPAVFLKLSHTQGKKYYIEKPIGSVYFVDSFLDINCICIKFSDYLTEIRNQHRDDKKNIANRNFSEWVCIISYTYLLILIIHHNYRT